MYHSTSKKVTINDIVSKGCGKGYLAIKIVPLCYPAFSTIVAVVPYIVDQNFMLLLLFYMGMVSIMREVVMADNKAIFSDQLNPSAILIPPICIYFVWIITNDSILF